MGIGRAYGGAFGVRLLVSAFRPSAAAIPSNESAARTPKAPPVDYY
jgi:hypothetical protein